MSLHDPIEPLRAPYIQKVLPAVYDDSLSYYELLCKMEEKVNQVVSKVNAQDSDIVAQDVAIAAIREVVDEFTAGGYKEDFEDFLDDWIENDSDEFLQRLIDEGVVPFIGDIEEEVDAVSSLLSTTRAELADLRDATDDALDYKVPYPLSGSNPTYGTLNQVLATNADGTTSWANPVSPTDEQAEEYIDAWLDEHPEATTTVADLSVTYPKLANSVRLTLLKGMGNLSTLAEMPQDANDIDANTMYMGNTSLNIANLPPMVEDNVTPAYFSIYTLSPQTSNFLLRFQICVRHNTGGYATSPTKVWFRGRWGSTANVWSDWEQINHEVGDGTITSQKLASNAVTSVKVADGAITEPKLYSSLVNKLIMSGGVDMQDVTDLDEIAPNTMRFFNTTIQRDNLPYDLIEPDKGAAYCTLVTISPQNSRNIRTQMLVRNPTGNYVDTAIWVRSKWGATTSTYSPWERLSTGCVYYATPSDFVEVIGQACLTRGSTVYLAPNSTFDMFDNHTEEYWLSHGIPNTTRYYGMRLYNDVRIVGLGNSEIVCDYDGEDASLIDGLSIFNILGDATIDNVTLTASGGRYCIHDDGQAQLGNVTSMLTVRNCLMHTNRLGGIGGGTGCLCMTRVIENNIVVQGQASENTFGISYHTNSTATNRRAHITVKDNVFMGCSYRYRQYNNADHAEWWYVVCNNWANVTPTKVIEGPSPNCHLMEYNNSIEVQGA